MNSIILPTYISHPEVEAKLGRCIDSLLENTVQPFEFVVVEQGPPFVIETRYITKPFVYVHYPQPIGFARAVNIGVYVSSGDNLFIVNNDIVVPSGWDEKLLNAYSRLPHKGGLLSPIEASRATEVDDFILNESWWSCVLISRNTWNRVGPLDDRALNYRLHDQDWSIRCHMNGNDVARYRGVTVQHDESSTYKHMQVDETSERATMRSRYGVEHYFEWVSRGPGRSPAGFGT